MHVDTGRDVLPALRAHGGRLNFLRHLDNGVRWGEGLTARTTAETRHNPEATFAILGVVPIDEDEGSSRV
jgi:hypothetical protein